MSMNTSNRIASTCKKNKVNWWKSFLLFSIPDLLTKNRSNMYVDSVKNILLPAGFCESVKTIFFSCGDSISQMGGQFARFERDSPLKRDSHLPKEFVLFASMKLYNEKCFLFHLKRSLRSQDISTFVLNFSSYRKNGLIRKLRLKTTRQWNLAS